MRATDASGDGPGTEVPRHRSHRRRSYGKYRERPLHHEELKDIGVNLTIDDFGTGFSSLGYLKHFHVDQLKIDKSFVRDIATDPEDASLCRAIISLAHNLKIGVVAEGVETEEQLRFLRENGCDLVQGYYLSKPLPAQEYAELLLKERTRPKA